MFALTIKVSCSILNEMGSIFVDLGFIEQQGTLKENFLV